MRRLSLRLGGRAVFGGLSAILEAERDLPFAAALVQALNLILLTAPEARLLAPPLPKIGFGSGPHPKDDLPLAAALVQALNLILLTAPEARPPGCLGAPGQGEGQGVIPHDDLPFAAALVQAPQPPTPNNSSAQCARGRPPCCSPSTSPPQCRPRHALLGRRLSLAASA